MKGIVKIGFSIIGRPKIIFDNNTEKAPTIITSIRVMNAAYIAIIYLNLLNLLANFGLRFVLKPKQSLLFI